MAVIEIPNLRKILPGDGILTHIINCMIPVIRNLELESSSEFIMMPSVMLLSITEEYYESIAGILINADLCNSIVTLAAQTVGWLSALAHMHPDSRTGGLVEYDATMGDADDIFELLRVTILFIGAHAAIEWVS